VDFSALAKVSKTATFRPEARNSAVQLMPITPAPKTAVFWKSDI
jgi:hypothetical protein